MRFGALVFCCFAVVAAAAQESDSDSDHSFNPMAFLIHFGYFNVTGLGRKAEQGDPGVQKRPDLSKAIGVFQKFNGLPVTGVLDSETEKLMKSPRCGVPDISSLARDGTSYRWEKSRLTYSIEKYSRKISYSKIRRAIDEAFKVWSRVIPLEFVEVSPSVLEVDIRIGFASGHHGDAWPFDGPGMVLAHAMYPKDGRTHFDDDENWRYEEGSDGGYGSTDLLAVAIHELGHALGLPHSSHPQAVMAPVYKELASPALHSDDIRRIQRLYGAPAETTTAPMTTTTAPKTPTMTTTAPTTVTTTTTASSKNGPSGRGGLRPFLPGPSLPFFPRPSRPSAVSCPNFIDAACGGIDASYIFSKDQVWTMKSGSATNKPEKVGKLYPDGPSTVSAAVFNRRNGITLLFQGRKVWGFVRKDGRFGLLTGFPKELPARIPFGPRTAMLGVHGHVVLLGESQFATYDEHWNVPTMVGETGLYFPFVTRDVKTVFDAPDGRTLLLTSDKFYEVFLDSFGAYKKTKERPIFELWKCGKNLCNS